MAIMFGAGRAMAVLADRDVNGKGQQVRPSLFENNMFLMAQHIAVCRDRTGCASLAEFHIGLGSGRHTLTPESKSASLG